MKKSPQLSLLGLILVAVLALLFPEVREQFGVDVGADSSAPARESVDRGSAPRLGEQRVDASIGFRSQRALDEHFEKHGGEFGRPSKDEYLRAAQALRDANVGGDVVEARRADGVTTRFDRSSGAFLAFNADRTIRTFFKPNDGYAYFQRQLTREGEGR